jgi:primosomal protein N' (replication factor Y)
MLYAKVVVGLPIDGPFDYLVPQSWVQKINIGVRVWVNFGNRRILGYVVGLAKKTAIKKIKPVLDILDARAVLDRNLLLLTKELADYYCCSWGEVIETALPEALRKGKRFSPEIGPSQDNPGQNSLEALLIQDPDAKARWDVYLAKIKETIAKNMSVICLSADTRALLKAQERISAGLGIAPAILYRKRAEGLEEWTKIKEGKARIVLGMRSAVFAPSNNLGLVIVDEEQDGSYKQDQVPHYHAREAAFMRMRLEKANLILGSSAPSLEAMYLAKKSKIKLQTFPLRADFPKVEVIDIKNVPFSQRKGNVLISRYLEDALSLTLASRGKALLFLNRKGFATSASCNSCAKVLKCPRCNVNLVYHFSGNQLSCHYCNFKMDAPKICPECNSGYIRYTGTGTEKIESELSRIFPQARISRIDNHNKLNILDADIFVATQAIIKEIDARFDLVSMLSVDNSLNRIDFRAAEKTFDILSNLVRLTAKKLIIQTRNPKHHVFLALANKESGIFYDEELKQRRQLGFPPYQHLARVKVRGINEAKVIQVSNALFQRLAQDTHKNIKTISVNPAQPAKLRGNFYWQVLVRAKDAKNLSRFLKNRLKKFSHSGIIVTVDVDPI